ncbi:MAG: SCP2 sterol-binding domain-containing protein [Bacillota bacterium]|nr:SCP2 sterol-binding domain-containing protein [Bacillota bacterium]
MTFDEKFKELKKLFVKPEQGGLNEDFAVQVNLTDKDAGGTFYIAYIGGELSVEPYDYHDYTAMITLSSTELKKLIKGEDNFTKAYLDSKIAIDGDINHAKLLSKLLCKEDSSSKTTKKMATKTATTKTATTKTAATGTKRTTAKKAAVSSGAVNYAASAQASNFTDSARYETASLDTPSIKYDDSEKNEYSEDTNQGETAQPSNFTDSTRYETASLDTPSIKYDDSEKNEYSEDTNQGETAQASNFTDSTRYETASLDTPFEKYEDFEKNEDAEKKNQELEHTKLANFSETSKNEIAQMHDNDVLLKAKKNKKDTLSKKTAEDADNSL